MEEYKEIRIVSSNKNIIQDFEDLFLGYKDKFQIKDDIYFKIMVAVTEGINNAAGHGNKFNPDKNVSVELVGNGNYMKCSITDEGLGFNPENLLKDNGRGVFLMRELANEFYVYNLENGTLVELVFNF